MIILKRRMFLFLIAIIGFTLVLASCAMPGSVEPKTGDSRFHNSIYYSGTSGKVGHHMSCELLGTCSGGWSYNHSATKIVSGSLPPGLKMSGSIIQGTPSQPGTWLVTIRISNLKCNEKTYPDKDVRVNFYIEGIAPKRLK